MDGCRSMAQESMKFSLIRLNNFMRDRTLKGLEGTDLKASFTPILAALGDTDGLTVSELSHITGLDKSNVTRNIQQLSELGYIVKDSRNSPITLTREGKDAACLIADIQREAYDELISCLDNDEKRMFIGIAAKVFRSVEDKGF